MPSPSPAVRAALLGLVVVTVLAVGGAALHLGSVQIEAERSLSRTLGAQASAVSVGLAPYARNAEALERAFARYAQAAGPVDLAVYDPVGRLMVATDRDRVTSVDWIDLASLADGDEALPGVQVGETRYVAGVSRSGETGAFVVAMQAFEDPLTRDVVLPTAVATLSLWGTFVGLLVIAAWYTGPRTATQLTLLGERLAQGAADGNALIRHASVWLGEFAGAFQPVADRFRQLGAEAQDRDQHVAALYQINPHYVILCALDGEVIEANPAFYAVTGLPMGTVRGGRVEALRESFPVEPLLELAARSIREGSAITGIEYGMIDRDGETRPVDVSLRGFTVAGRELVLFQATDLARQKTLERRVAAFSDTLDLMVDQRVQQLTAGQQSIQTVLDAAGLVVASFDAGGATSRWNGGARALTGKPADSVPHFAAATAVLGLSPTERTAFTRWFWSPTADPFVGRHGVISGDGATRVRQFIWQRVDADIAGRSDLRTLIGVEIPAAVEVRGEALARAAPMAAPLHG